jgi:hypothetical protein
MSRLALGHTPEAIRDLEEVLRLGHPELESPTEWYLALAHLRGPDPTAARSRLERIAAGGGFYREKARALLRQLDRAPSRP